MRIDSPAVTAPPPVLRFWRALDERLATVRPTRWGAVVTDARFPLIWDANYARLDADLTGLTVAEVERELVPTLRTAGAEIEHVVVFDPEAATGVLTELSTRGHRLSWDLVMAWDGRAAQLPRATERVRPIALGEAAWRDIRASLTGPFGIEEGEPIEQMMRLEREVLAPAGKRWFGIRHDDRWVSVAAAFVLDAVAYVDNVATDEAFRGRGYATEITAAIVDHALREGVETVFLLADPEDRGAVGIYERLGFREVARLASTRGPLPR